MVRHPPDCAACAANRAALLRNAPPPRVCELSRREQHLRSPRPPLRQIACPQQTRYAPPSRVPAPSATPSKPKTLAARSATSASAAIAPYQAGLKAFTSLVADKLVRFRSIQHTALADMLVAEALDGCQDKPCYDSMTIDKNIRRRTYDTLNVFASMGIVVRSELSDDRLSVGLSFDTPFRVLHDYTLVDLVMNCSLNKSAHARPHTQQNQNLNPASSAP
ncbi:unnamed protein product [Agarophyton chilense]